jgi:hypothetical protein
VVIPPTKHVGMLGAVPSWMGPINLVLPPRPRVPTWPKEKPIIIKAAYSHFRTKPRFSPWGSTPARLIIGTTSLCFLMGRAIFIKPYSELFLIYLETPLRPCAGGKVNFNCALRVSYRLFQPPPLGEKQEHAHAHGRGHLSERRMC